MFRIDIVNRAGTLQSNLSAPSVELISLFTIISTSCVKLTLLMQLAWSQSSLLGADPPEGSKLVWTY